MKKYLFQIVLLVSSSLYGQTWSPPVNAEPTEGSQGGSVNLSVKILNGLPSIVYQQPGTPQHPNGFPFFVRSKNATGSEWETPVVIDPAAGAAGSIDVMMVEGNPAAAWYDNVKINLKYARALNPQGTAWGPAISVNGLFASGFHIQMLIVNGNPAIAYYDAQKAFLMYIRANDALGTSWGTPMVLDSNNPTGSYLSMKIINGNPAISYDDIKNNLVKYIRANDASGASWGAPVTVAPGGGGGTSLHVVNGAPAIAYGAENYAHLKYIRATDISGTSWGTPVTVDAAAISARLPSMQVVNGIPNISYNDYTTGDVKYLSALNASGTSWNAPFTVVSDNTPSNFSGRAVSSAASGSFVGIAYYNEKKKSVYFTGLVACTPPPAPVSTTDNKNLSVCSGSSANLSVTNTGSGNLAWYSTATGGAILANGSTYTTQALFETTTFYVQDSTCAVSPRTPIVVTVNSLPVAGISGVSTICNGTNTTLTASGGNSYLWSTGETSSSVTVSTTGTYTVTVSNNNGCTASSNQVVNVYNNPVVVLTPGNFNGFNVSCNGGNNGSISSTVNQGTSPFYYNWSNGASSASLTNLTTGNYSLVVTDANGCTANGGIALSEPAALVASTFAGDVSCFGGNNGSANVSVNGGVSPYSYLWSTGATTSAVSNLRAGTYTVTTTDKNGCLIISSVSVSEASALTALTTSSNVSCFGGNNGSASVLTSGGTTPYSYNWSNGVHSSTVSGLTAGNYSLTVIDGHGCSVVSSLSISQPPSLVVNAGADKSICFGSAVIIGGSPTSSGGTSPYNYTWTPSAGLSSTNIANPIASANTTKTYTVNVTDAKGCISNDAVVVTVNAPVVASITSLTDNDRCGRNIQIFTGYGAQSVPLHASGSGGSGSYSYLWSPSLGLSSTTSANPNASPTVTTTYTVVITDLMGCTASASVVVNVMDIRCGKGLLGQQLVYVCNINKVLVAGIYANVQESLCLDRTLVSAFLLVNPQACLGTCNPSATVHMRTSNPDASLKESMANEITASAYPNPFAEDVYIEINSAKSVSSKIEIIDIIGRTILVKDLGVIEAGKTVYNWNGNDFMNAKVENGIYICKVTIGNTVKNLRLSFQK